MSIWRTSSSRTGLRDVLTLLLLSATFSTTAGRAAGSLSVPRSHQEQDRSKSALPRPQPLYEQDRQKYFGMTALAGAISCSLTHVVVVPLDVIKTTLQTDASLRGPRSAITSIMRKGASCRLGVAPLFNGVGATAVGYFLQGATKFGGYEYIKHSIIKGIEESGSVGADVAKRLKLPIMLTSAAAAELVACGVLCPLEVVKLRMQLSPSLAAAGLGNAILQVVRGEGLAALYAGFLPITMRQGTLMGSLCCLATHTLSTNLPRLIALACPSALAQCPTRRASLWASKF